MQGATGAQGEQGLQGVKDGVKIGAKAVVGMNSMVTKNVDEAAIVVGNPAQFIRYRD